MTVLEKIKEYKAQLRQYQKYMNYCTGIENIEKLAHEIINLSVKIQILNKEKISKSNYSFDNNLKIKASKIN